MLFAPRDANEYDRWFFISEKAWKTRIKDPRFYKTWRNAKNLERLYR